jgi:hypothetical protein
MNRFLLRITYAALLILLLPFTLFAQEKDLAYYDSHPGEILPDAQNLFMTGAYERVVQLCEWHYFIVGNQEANALRDKAEKCAQLSTELAYYQSEGKVQEVKETAQKLLSINPNDVVAKELLAKLEEPEVPEEPEDPVVPVVPEVVEPEEQENIVPAEPVVEDTHPEQVQENIPILEKVPVPESLRTKFLIKAGVSVLDLKQFAQTIAPGGSLGAYDLGGSLFGVEAGLFLCPGLSARNASLFGIDASMVIRAANGIYPKVGVGFLSCTSKLETGGSTKGLCAGLGVTILIGGHFCVEVGAKYFPKVNLLGTEMVSTAGVSYEFPMADEIITGGIAPMLCFGWTF